MPDIAGICIFISIMTALSIPIIAVLKWKPKNKALKEKIEEMEKRLDKLENENASKTLELSTIRNEISFTTKLLDGKSE